MMRLLLCCIGAVAASYHAPPARQLPRRATPAQLSFLSEPWAPTGSTQEREAALSAWLADNGVELSDKAGWGRPAHPMRMESDTVEDFEISGRGLIARKEIVQGEAVLRIPSKIVLTKERAQSVLGTQVVSDELNEYLALALLLMNERGLGDKSFWSAYINLLPTTEEVGQTWVWDEADMAMLAGSGLVASTESLRAKIQREYEMITNDIVKPNGLDPSTFTFEAFEWAMSMLFSRAIDLCA